MKRIEKIIGIGMLLFALAYNFWIYKTEPTSKIDPNDNPFQYALVYRTNEMWDFAATECPKNPMLPLCFVGYLIDHNVPNWAQGYSLPYYYSHVPQIAIVASYKLLSLIPGFVSLFTYYHWVIYLLLCIFPLSIFLSLRILKFPWYVAGFGALMASQISTDGLYGLDPSSFLWRGYGLSSQLFAMFWMPLAIAYGIRLFHESVSTEYWTKRLHWKSLLTSSYAIFTSKSFLLALLFLSLSITGHLGLGFMTIISFGVIAISKLITGFLEKEHTHDLINIAIDQFLKLILVAGSTILLLSYWIIPVLINGKYHNNSFWDPVWKFNSWGWKDVVTQFIDGNLFDFGRFPMLTILVVIGGFAAVYFSTTLVNSSKKHFAMSSEQDEQNSYHLATIGVLFLFWFILFFGRATLGSIIDILPGMKDFHQSRFIVGVHLMGFFLIPIGFWWLTHSIIQLLYHSKRVIHLSQQLITDDDESQSKKPNKTHTIPIHALLTLIVGVSLTVIIILIVSPQTQRYASHNDFLILRGNENYDKQHADADSLLNILSTNQPGRVFAGRGSQWGKELNVAETTYFMHLSTFGIPVILWLPETWSPNSDVEQFFVEDWPEHYDLLNVRYIVTPKDVEPKEFWTKIAESDTWNLYTAPTSGYFTTGSKPSVIYSDRDNYVNLVRLWMQSDYVKKHIFPELTYDHTKIPKSTIPAFSMVDEATYELRDGKQFSLFEANPSYEAPPSNVTLGTQHVRSDMVYTTDYKTGNDCEQCLVILKASYHPNWKAFVNGKPTEAVTVFPFYIGVSVPPNSEGTIEVRYQPSHLKILLFVLGPIFVIMSILISKHRQLHKK